MEKIRKKRQRSNNSEAWLEQSEAAATTGAILQQQQEQLPWFAGLLRFALSLLLLLLFLLAVVEETEGRREGEGKRDKGATMGKLGLSGATRVTADGTAAAATATTGRR